MLSIPLLDNQLFCSLYHPSMTDEVRSESIFLSIIVSYMNEYSQSSVVVKSTFQMKSPRGS